MGRDLYLYKLDASRIQTHLAKEIEKTPEGTISFADWLQRAPIKKAEIVRKIASNPFNLAGEEIHSIETWFCNRKSYTMLEWDEMQQEKAACGLIEIHTVGITRHCCVIMEQFCDFLPEIVDTARSPDYVLSKQELMAFLDWLVLLFGIILLEEGMGDKEENLALLTKYNPQSEGWLKAKRVYSEQVQLRQELGEAYHGKWATDYFETAWLAFVFNKIQSEIALMEDTIFYLQDSY